MQSSASTTPSTNSTDSLEVSPDLRYFVANLRSVCWTAATKSSPADRALLDDCIMALVQQTLALSKSGHFQEQNEVEFRKRLARLGELLDTSRPYHLSKAEIHILGGIFGLKNGKKFAKKIARQITAKSASPERLARFLATLDEMEKRLVAREKKDHEEAQAKKLQEEKVRPEKEAEVERMEVEKETGPKELGCACQYSRPSSTSSKRFITCTSPAIYVESGNIHVGLKTIHAGLKTCQRHHLIYAKEAARLEKNPPKVSGNQDQSKNGERSASLVRGPNAEEMARLVANRKTPQSVSSPSKTTVSPSKEPAYPKCEYYYGDRVGSCNMTGQKRLIGNRCYCDFHSNQMPVNQRQNPNGCDFFYGDRVGFCPGPYTGKIYGFSRYCDHHYACFAGSVAPPLIEKVEPGTTEKTVETSTPEKKDSAETVPPPLEFVRCRSGVIGNGPQCPKEARYVYENELPLCSEHYDHAKRLEEKIVALKRDCSQQKVVIEKAESSRCLVVEVKGDSRIQCTEACFTGTEVCERHRNLLVKAACQSSSYTKPAAPAETKPAAPPAEIKPVGEKTTETEELGKCRHGAMGSGHQCSKKSVVLCGNEKLPLCQEHYEKYVRATWGWKLHPKTTDDDHSKCKVLEKNENNGISVRCEKDGTRALLGTTACENHFNLITKNSVSVQVKDPFIEISPLPLQADPNPQPAEKKTGEEKDEICPVTEKKGDQLDKCEEKATHQIFGRPACAYHFEVISNIVCQPENEVVQDPGTKCIDPLCGKLAVETPRGRLFCADHDAAFHGVRGQIEKAPAEECCQYGNCSQKATYYSPTLRQRLCNLHVSELRYLMQKEMVETFKATEAKAEKSAAKKEEPRKAETKKEEPACTVPHCFRGASKNSWSGKPLCDYHYDFWCNDLEDDQLDE